ncbi:alpha/beta-hydrolase [Meredithblackwellia eburnea MCA 4105]
MRSVTAVFRGLTSLGQPTAIKDQLAKVPAGVTRKRVQIQSRQAGRSILVDVYEKEGSNSDKGPRPINLNFHGSAFILPNLGTDAWFCGLLAHQTGAVVLDCDYRKAPENPFPAAFNDAEDIYNHLKSEPSVYDLTRVTLSGFSAGANLAMALSISLPAGTIHSLATFYGNPNISEPLPPSPEAKFTSGVLAPEALRRLSYDCYLLPSQSRTDVRVSPVLAPVNLWPKNVFVTCGRADTLWSHNQALVDYLEKGGKDVSWISVSGAAHAFDKVPRNPDEGTRKNIDEAYESAVDVLRKGLL